MRTRGIVLGIALLVAMVASATHAQEASGFREGDRTFTLSGSGSSDKDFDASIAALEMGMGWFVSDQVAVQLRQGIGFADVEGGDNWNGSTRLGLDYFMNAGRVKPFVGVGIGYLYGDGVEEQFVAGPDAGVRVFVNDTTFVNLGIEYQFLFEDADEAKDSYDDGRFVYAVGMGVKW